jgi:hypothetical protein
MRKRSRYLDRLQVKQMVAISNFIVEKLEN